MVDTELGLRRLLEALVVDYRVQGLGGLGGLGFRVQGLGGNCRVLSVVLP